MAVSVGMARASANASEQCGDAAQAWLGRERAVVAIADGLGHGAAAADAALRAMAYVGDHLAEEPLALFRGLHEELRSTRGAAVGLAIIEPQAGRITYTAVGNTRAAVFGWQVSRLDGYAGIVGGGYRRLAPVVVPFRTGDRLVLWTDGLDERLVLGSPVPEMPQVLAESLLQRFGRHDDDACVIVAQLDAA